MKSLKEWLERKPSGRKPKRPLPRVTKKRAKQNREYTVERYRFLTAHPTCQYPQCFKASEEIHHRKGRIGKLLVDPRWFMATCRAHHILIHSHPSEARELGLIIP